MWPIPTHREVLCMRKHGQGSKQWPTREGRRRSEQLGVLTGIRFASNLKYKLLLHFFTVLFALSKSLSLGNSVDNLYTKHSEDVSEVQLPTPTLLHYSISFEIHHFHHSLHVYVLDEISMPLTYYHLKQ
jgi:hypothetical protein